MTPTTEDKPASSELLLGGEDAFRLLVDSIKDYAVFLLDPQGTILSWNAGAERIKGWRAEEIIGRSFSAFYTRDDVAIGVCERGLKRALRDGRFEDEGWRVRKDGSRFWADVVITALYDRAGRHVGFAKVTRDQTDRAFRLFVEATNSIVWTTDAAGHPNADSPTWRAFTGQSREDWMAPGAWDPVHPEDQPTLRSSWAAAQQERRPFEAEFRLRRHDGQYGWMGCRAIPILSDEGVVREWFGVTFDISARKRAEIERGRLEEERAVLLERERLARADAEAANHAKDEFLATVSHELRTPLNAILGWAAMLRRKGVPKDAERGLGIIERNALAQAHLIEDMLDISRIISGKLRLEMGETDVARAIDEAIDVVRPAAEAKGIVLVVDVEQDIGGIVADAGRLQQIVWNLLSNAVKFTPQDGRVELTGRRDGSSVVIVISDTGKGIAPAALPTIFEPFRQADASTTRVYGGLGLGLAIVRQLVQAHGGTIRAESAGEGRGATFRVDLPARSTAPLRRSRFPPSATDSAPRLDGLRVLVVDDEEDARDLVREALTAAGASVESASSSVDAVAKLQSFGPDVLISDIGMADEDGYSLMRKIRALPAVDGGRTQALALTAFAREEDALQAFAAGYQMHLAKPTHPTELIAAVANLAGVLRV